MHHGRKLRVAILRQNCTMAPACLHLSIMLPLRNATVVLHVSRRRVLTATATTTVILPGSCLFLYHTTGTTLA